MWHRSIDSALPSGLAILIAVLGACSFSNTVDEDFVPAISVGFVDATSTADEKSMGHPIGIKLSELSTADVDVHYEIVGGTATPGVDFDTTTGELTIPAGVLDVELILAIKADTDGTEPDETVDLALSMATGATILPATRTHQVTILSKALPRVSFRVAELSGEEEMDPVVDVVLDEPSEFEITVNYTVAPAGATPDNDYILTDGNISFAPGQTTRSIPLDILDDQLDEDPESVDIMLTTATNAFVDTTKNTFRYTILDSVDPAPFVGFAAPASNIGEAGGTAMITVQLSTVSGRTVTVPFSVDAAGSSATATTDYSIVGTSITIPPGQPSANIAVAIVDDMLDDEAETVKIDLGAATNATLMGTTSHVLTIDDDDDFCLGANAAIDVCFATRPAGSLDLSGAINTDTDVRCAATQPSGWTPTQDPACVIARGDITVTGATTVTGSRPLVLFATNNLTVNANLDASSKQGGSTGPGTSPATCAPASNPANNTGGAGGGAGGSFLTLGGAGGSGNNTAAAGGMPAPAVTAPTKLRPGCAGQKGGNAMSSQGGAGGGAGGALYLLAGNTLAIANNIAVNVSGAGGSPSASSAGGGGGGSGGMLVLHSGVMQVLGNATKLVANGGGGSGGGAPAASGSAGQDPLNPSAYDEPAAGGAGGSALAGNGGGGFALNNPAVAGFPGAATGGGGGGGGGGGYILSNRAFGNADVSAGLSVP